MNKFDNFDNIFTYSENGWEHSTMDSFKNYKRTISHGAEGAYFTVDFEGTGIILTGVQKGDTVVRIEVDGAAAVAAAIGACVAIAKKKKKKD